MRIKRIFIELCITLTIFTIITSLAANSPHKIKYHYKYEELVDSLQSNIILNNELIKKNIKVLEDG